MRESSNLIQGMPLQFFVPCWMDQGSTNAQNSNAKALLSRFKDARARWTAVCGDFPAELIRQNGIETIRLGSTRSWELRAILAYQAKVDGIFYPGPHWSDKMGIKVRGFSRRRIPVIATMEGVIADPDSVRQLSDL